jgi:hypothetical protein
MGDELKLLPTSYSPSPWLQIIGWVSMPGIIALTARLVYEQTVLTWRDGMQAVGYSLGHAYALLFLWMLLSVLGAIGYFLAVVVVSVIRRVRSERLQLNLPFVIALVFLFGILMIPYEVWMAVGVHMGFATAHQVEYLVYGAASGHKYLVDAVLKNGVPVDASESRTALNAACASKEINMARYLISKGADLNRAPECKWVPEVGGKVLPRVPGTTVEVKP